MATIECKNCGATITLPAGQTTGTCEYCGSSITLTSSDNMQTAATVNIQSLLKRIELFLEDGDWNDAKEYCEKVLDMNPECAHAYLYKLMAKLKVHNRTELMLCDRAIFSMKNYEKAVRFADSELKNVLEELSLNNRYHTAQLRMEEATTEAEYKFAAQLFERISTFKDSAQQKEKCMELMEEARKAAIEKEAQNKLELEKQNELKKMHDAEMKHTLKITIALFFLLLLIVFVLKIIL